MKSKLFIIILLLSACARSEVSLRANISNNDEFYNKYFTNTRIMPMYNIPSILDKDNSNNTENSKNIAEASYDTYHQEYQRVKKFSSSINRNVKEYVDKSKIVIKYQLNKQTGEYELIDDSSSQNLTISDLNNQYMFTSNNKHNVVIPYKNAITIQELNQQGITPNEKYLSNVTQLKPKYYKTVIYEPSYHKTKYSKTEIDMLAGTTKTLDNENDSQNIRYN